MYINIDNQNSEHTKSNSEEEIVASDFKNGMDGKSWEKYCEKILRFEYDSLSVTTVPDEDRGDHGIEFFTNCGIIYQCYYPKPEYSMDEYKKKVKKKINDDIKKLSVYEKEIRELLDTIKINKWILMIPQNRSRDLIKYCNKKKKEVIEKGLEFINDSDFTVIIATDETFPTGSHYARRFHGEVIDLKVVDNLEIDSSTWKKSNSEFYDNICRKTKKIERNVDAIREKLIIKYVEINDLLSGYRIQFPDIYDEILEIAEHNLVVLMNDSLFADEVKAEGIIKELLVKNRKEIDSLETKISKDNKEIFSFGFVAQWIAECKMDFIVDYGVDNE